MPEEKKIANAVDWHSLSVEATQDRRRGKRVQLTYPIEISGFDHSGRLFSEKTKTQDISETGCRFVLRTPLARGDVVAIKIVSQSDEALPSTKALLFQIAWVRRQGDGWMAGALKLQPDKLWRVAFPPNNLPDPAAR